MRNLLRGKRVYIDTNVFIYVALKHPQYYESCRAVLEMLLRREFVGYGSHLVVFELFAALSRISVEAAYEAVNAYLDLPIHVLELGRETLDYAKEIAALSGTTYDAMHAALVAQNGVEIVVTEDVGNWSRIARIWPRIKERFGARELMVVSPTRGAVKT